MTDKSHEIWKSAFGDGPWPCERCDELVISVGGGNNRNTGVVHHADENHDNNEVSNLRVMHQSCHIAHHNNVRFISKESRQRMSVAQKNRRAKEPPEVRDKFIKSMTGRTHTPETIARIKITKSKRSYEVSDETRQRISKAARGNKNMAGKARSAETREKIAAKLRGRKKSPETLARITEANRKSGEARRLRNQSRREQRN
jgi:hypothetical protein